jgi:hypothetical protein
VYRPAADHLLDKGADSPFESIDQAMVFSLKDQQFRLDMHPTWNTMGLGLQIAWLLVLGIPVACVAWSVTHEEVFREPRQYCQRECTQARSLVRRKFFYLFTCEYCFSHYVAAAMLVATRYKLLYADWRGYLVAFFALVWVANQYMSIYNRLRLDIKHEQVEIKADEQKVGDRKVDARKVDHRKAA